MRVLVIEDDGAVSEYIRGALADAGHSVVRASNGATGDCVARASVFDAVVLDLGLPDIDGLTLLRQWRSGGLTLWVVVVTARSGWCDRRLAVEAGADDYLAKPFAMGDLLRRLEARVALKAE